MKKIIYTILLLWAPLNIMAQNNTIQGKLTDQQTGAAIAGASIFYQQQYTISDERGVFKLDHTSKRSAKLIVSHIGYETYEETIDATSNSMLNISLNSSIRLLEEVLISSDSRPTVSQHRIDQKSIMRDNPKNVGDIFGDQPGFGIIKRGGYAMDPVFRS